MWARVGVYVGVAALLYALLLHWADLQEQRLEAEQAHVLALSRRWQQRVRGLEHKGQAREQVLRRLQREQRAAQQATQQALQQADSAHAALATATTAAESLPPLLREVTTLRTTVAHQFATEQALTAQLRLMTQDRNDWRATAWAADTTITDLTAALRRSQCRVLFGAVKCPARTHVAAVVAVLTVLATLGVEHGVF